MKYCARVRKSQFRAKQNPRFEEKNAHKEAKVAWCPATNFSRPRQRKLHVIAKKKQSIPIAKPPRFAQTALIHPKANSRT